MNLRDCQEVACAADVETFEGALARFGHDLGFGIMTGLLVCERPNGLAEKSAFGSVPEAYRSTYESHDFSLRSPVTRRLKRLRVPFVYDQAMYVDEGAGDIWEAQAPYGFKNGIALTLESQGGRYFVIGVDREQALPRDALRLAKLMADLFLFAAYAQVAALRLLQRSQPDPQALPTLTGRELEILKWTAAGKSAWAVGQILNLSEHHVNYCIRRIMSKLDVASKFQAAAQAHALGLI